MFRRKFIRISSGIVITGTVAGCSGNNGNEAATTTNDKTTSIETTTATNEETTIQEIDGETTAQKSPTDLDLKSSVGQIPSGLKVIDTEIVRTDEGSAGAHLTGVIRNTTNREFDEIEVQATLFSTLYDDTADGEIVGTYFDNTEGAKSEQVVPLDSGDQWKFTIDFPQAILDQAVRYRIDVDATIDNSVYEVKTETETRTETRTTTTTNS